MLAHGMSAFFGLLDRLLEAAKALPDLRRDRRRKATLRHLLREGTYRWRSIGALPAQLTSMRRKLRNC
jgi:hypothetical protein